MAATITYTSNLGLPQIDQGYDGALSATAMKDMSTVLDTLLNYIVVSDGKVVTANGQVVINTPLTKTTP